MMYPKTPTLGHRRYWQTSYNNKPPNKMNYERLSDYALGAHQPIAITSLPYNGPYTIFPGIRPSFYTTIMILVTSNWQSIKEDRPNLLWDLFLAFGWSPPKVVLEPWISFRGTLYPESFVLHWRYLPPFLMIPTYFNLFQWLGKKL